MLKNYSTLLMGKTPTKRALYRNQEESIESTVYNDYPKHKPFINDDYERPVHKPVSSYPEGNRTAVVNALKNLQEKIHQLEVERSAAEDNLKSLASETNKYRNILHKDNERLHPTQTTVSKQNQELESQLTAAETRCDLLEKQLDYMRTMVHSAEKDRHAAVSRVTFAEPKEQEPSLDFQTNLRKISELERQHIKLTANQSLAESKIRELEEKLGEERHHRKLMVEKAAELESAAHSNKMLADIEEFEKERPPSKSKRHSKKKKRQVVSKKTGHNQKPDASKHYRLNLADIPFVAGKNTGPSHSVGANVQKVFSLMKNHNMALCSRASHPMNTCYPGSISSSGSSSPTTESDLAEILLQLQDEFHQMSFEHQEFSKEISDTTDPRVREDLERELDALVSRMEAKSQQISKIRKHQEKVAEKKKQKKKSHKKYSDFEEPPRPKSALASYNTKINSSPRYNGEVEVTTTIKSKGPGAGVVRLRPTSAREISLNVLRDMKKLQTTLRKDDLSWE